MKLPKDTLHSIEGKLMSSVGAACERASFRQCRHAGMWLGLFFHHIMPSRRKISVDNLQLAFPHLTPRQADRMARRVSQNAAMTFCEFLHMRATSEQEMRDYSWLENYEHFQSGFDAGRGVIVLTGHIGNWELMGARAGMEFKMAVVARPRSNPIVHAHIESIRARANVEVISRFDTGRAPLKALRRNEGLAILPDQYEKGGKPMQFFGHPTHVVDAVARLAMLSGARVVPSFGIRREPWLSDGRIIGKTFPGFNVPKTGDRERDVEEGNRRVFAEIENVIRLYPDQWLWMHRRWREEDLKAKD